MYEYDEYNPKKKDEYEETEQESIDYSADGMEDEPHVDGESIEMEAEVISGEEYTEEISGEQIFTGMNFVITGSLEHFSNRGEAKNLIESLGGKVTGSVTGNTNYLINNDVTSNSSKNKKARELGIPILSEEDFLKLAER